jgi:peptidoglycan/LPS O-acetylase OafA/YrhL
MRNSEAAVAPSVSREVATTYYGWFDWLRFALAATVMFSHDGMIKWKAAGNFAVQVFFALSGWLIGGILCKTETSELPRFYFNRALRIWCPYLLALGFLLSAGLLRDRISPKWGEIAFYKATFVYNLFGTRQLAQHAAEMPMQGTGNHFWSVNAEEQFYLLAPLLLVFLPRKYGRSVITWSVLAALALITKTYASIVFGVLAAVFASKYGAFNESRWCRLTASLTITISVIALAAEWDYELVVPFCAISIVLFLAVKRAPLFLGEFAGGMSYPLYLNAWVASVLLNVTFKRFGISNQPLKAVLGPISGLLLAAILYRFFDRPILNSRRRLYTPTRARIAMASAYGAIVIGSCVGAILYFRN